MSLAPFAISTSILCPFRENIRRSCKICALDSSLNGSDDDSTMYIKCGPCRNLLDCRKSLEDTDVDPFKGIPENEVSIEDVSGLTIDPDNSAEDRMLRLTNCFSILRSS